MTSSRSITILTIFGTTLGFFLAAMLSGIGMVMLENRETLQRLEGRTEDRWTEGDMIWWAHELHRRNPDLIVPDVKHSPALTWPPDKPEKE